jgi:hypothetical protein
MCVIFVVKSGTGAVSSPSTEVFPFSVIPPMHHIHLLVYFRRHIFLAIDGMVKWRTQKSKYDADEDIWAKEEEISGSWRKFHIGELDDLPSDDQIKEVISETWCE